MPRQIGAVAIALLLLLPVFGQPGQSDNPSQVMAIEPVGNQMLDLSGLRPIRTENAVYPEAAREGRIEGKIWVKVLITEAGNVEEAGSSRGDPGLIAAAVAAAKEWKFTPFVKDGRAIAVRTAILFDFAGSAAESRSAEIEGKLLIPALVQHQVKPEYPEKAKQHRIQGQVVLRLVIGKDGRITDIRPDSGPPELIPAAIKAVQKWRYRPFLLNGEPLAVETTIKVNFALSG
jgi:TonB family protein